jgi:hypothetical protein
MRVISSVTSGLFLALATTGCFSYRSVAPVQPPAGAVRVTYASPRTVVVNRSSDVQVSISGSTQVVGRVNRVSGDTLYVQVESIRGRDGLWKARAVDGIAVVVQDPQTTVERRVFSRDKTLGFILGGAAILTAIFIAIKSAGEGGEVVY